MGPPRWQVARSVRAVRISPAGPGVRLQESIVTGRCDSRRIARADLRRPMRHPRAPGPVMVGPSECEECSKRGALRYRTPKPLCGIGDFATTPIGDHTKIHTIPMDLATLATPALSLSAAAAASRWSRKRLRGAEQRLRRIRRRSISSMPCTLRLESTTPGRCIRKASCSKAHSCPQRRRDADKGTDLPRRGVAGGGPILAVRGVPDLPDNSDGASPAGFAIKIKEADGEAFDVEANQHNGFIVPTADEFADFLRALGASGPGVPSPTPVETFLSTHPGARTFLATRTYPVSYATATYLASIRSSSRAPRASRQS